MANQHVNLWPAADVVNYNGLPPGWSVGGGPAQTEVGAASALGETYTTTYVESPASGTRYFGMRVLNLAANVTEADTILQVKPWIWQGGPFSDTSNAIDVYLRVYRGNLYREVLVRYGGQVLSGSHAVPCPWVTTSPWGGPWTVADVNTAAWYVRYRQISSNPTVARIYGAYLEVEFNERPAVSNLAVAYANSRSRPQLSWTYTDPEDDDQYVYWTKVFSSAQYSAAGFDPASSTATWDPKGQFGSENIVDIGKDLTNGTYRAYVEVYDRTSYPRWRTANPLFDTTLWANYVQWTQNVVLPGAPGLTAVADNANDRVALTISGGTLPSGASNTFWAVERSDDGATWNSVYGLDNVTTAGTVYDYGAPGGQTVRYRARAWTTVNTDLLVGARSSPVSVVTAPPGYWKIVDLDAPANSLQISVQQVTFRSEAREGVFAPLSAGYPVVISDANSGLGETLDLTISTKSQDAFDRFETLRLANRTLLLRSDLPSEQWSGRIISGRNATMPISISRRTNPFRAVTFTFLQVAPQIGTR